MAFPVPFATAQVSYSQWILLALHFAPVRSEVAAPTARSSLFFRRAMSLTANPLAPSRSASCRSVHA
jgi:hypothetical protein